MRWRRIDIDRWFDVAVGHGAVDPNCLGAPVAVQGEGTHFKVARVGGTMASPGATQKGRPDWGRESPSRSDGSLRGSHFLRNLRLLDYRWLTYFAENHPTKRTGPFQVPSTSTPLPLSSANSPVAAPLLLAARRGIGGASMRGIRSPGSL